jgi:hypothetical protein
LTVLASATQSAHSSQHIQNQHKNRWWE